MRLPEPIRIAHVEHHGAKVIGVEHPVLHFGAGDSGALPQPEEFIHVKREPRGRRRIDNLGLNFAESEFAEFGFNNRRSSKANLPPDGPTPLVSR